MTPQAYLYICDGNIDDPVLTHKKMDWPEKYSHWQEIPLVMAQRQWVGLTEREVELIDGMIEVELKHAERCDRIANRNMAEKQKGWDMERVELLRKIKQHFGVEE